MQCFFDSLHVTAHYYLAYALYSGKNFDTLPTCLHIMTAPLTGLNVGMSLVFFTAVDRLIALLLPIKHPQLDKALYLGAFLLLGMAYNIYILYIGYLNAEQHKNTMVVCLIVESEDYILLSIFLNMFTKTHYLNIITGLHGTPGGVWSITAAAFVFGAITVYIIIGILIHAKKFTNSSVKLYKSLLILCIIFVFSWSGSLTLFLCTVFGLSEELTFFLSIYMGLTINTACASNFFVLTRYSKEYRSAARKFFKKCGVDSLFKPASGPVSSVQRTT